MIESGHQYHWLTAYNRGRMRGHSLDWENQPAFFKEYPDCETFPLPLPDFASETPLSFFQLLRQKKAAVADYGAEVPPFQRHDLARILLLTSAPTARSRFEHGEIWYRSNASAGALHPLEFYLEFPGCADLPVGLYHYDLLQPALQRLRGYSSPALSGEAAVRSDDSSESADLNPTATIYISAVFWRTAWKYRERAYRYLLLDCGHALENLTLALTFSGLNFTVELDFDDALVNENLHLFAQQREVTLAKVKFSLPSSTIPEISDQPDDSEPALQTDHNAESGIIYPDLLDIHRATSVPLINKSVSEKSCFELFSGDPHWQKIPSENSEPKSTHSYVNTLSRRRSRRNFTEKGGPINTDMLFLLLDLLSVKSTADARLRPGILFSARGIDNFPDGLYCFDCEQRSFALIENCARHRELAVAALDQRWVANAALKFIFFADLELAEKEFLPRSYRYFNLEAGCLGQRLYLGATALDLGCCAVGAFYDRELAEICRLSENYDPLYLVAIGPIAG